MIAYEQARKTMRGVLPLKADLASGACWLVLGAALSHARRRGFARASTRHAPVWGALTRAEQNCLQACWRILGPEEADALTLADDYPFLLLEKKALEQARDTMAGSAEGITLSRSRLRRDTLRRAGYAREASTGQGGRPLHEQIAYLLDLAAALEARFGARRDTLPDPRGFQLSVLEADPAWLARYRDPEFWHVLVPILAELSFVTSFARQVLPTLDWIFEQPDCDRATAAAGFILLDGPRLAPLAPGAANGWEQEQQRQSLCQKIAWRAKQGLYPQQHLLLSCLGLEDDLSAHAGTAAMPAALFGARFSGHVPMTPFYLDDGTLFMAML